MWRIVKKEAVLGARKPLMFSDSVAGGYSKLTGVGVFIPAIENQYASDHIVPSSRQSAILNAMIGYYRISYSFGGGGQVLGHKQVHLTDGTSANTFLLNNGADENSFTLTGKEINSNGQRTFYLYLDWSSTPPQDFQPLYYGKDQSYAFDTASGLKKDTLTATTTAGELFAITLKKSDTLNFNIESGVLEISRTLPIFSVFNGISVRMQINNLQDNPICDIYQPKITMPFTINPTTTEEAMRGMKKALFFNVFEDSRLIQMNYDIKKHTKLDFIIDLNAGNTINHDYIGESCDLKVYLRYE